MKKLTVPFLLLAVGAAHAQSFSSFTSAEFINGVSVHSSNNSRTYGVSLASGAKVRFEGTTYDVTQLFGFYLLGAKNSLGSPTDAGGTDWSFSNSNTQSGQAAGWNHNANSGRLNAGDNVSLSFSTVTPTTTYGYHLTYVTSNGTVKTGYFKANAVPEPATFAVIGLGALGVIRRRRKTA